MKKLIKPTIIFTFFSLSIILFQLSCQDEVEAQSGTFQPSNRFLYAFGIENDITGEADTEYWTVKNDGTDNKKIPITLTTGLHLEEGARLTPDGQTLIFRVTDTDDVDYIYSVSIDGTNLKKLIDGVGATEGQSIYYDLQQTY